MVAIYDVGTHGDRVWIAIEYVAGNTLREWARLRPRTWSETARVLTDAARGVAAAHAAGLVHGDLKPDNIMIESDDRVRVMDFGLARVLDLSMTELELASTPSPPEPKSAYSTQPGEVHGTPPYISPERWLGEAAGPAADQFAWSVMAWELLYGERPFVGATKKALKDKIVMGQRSAPPRGLRVPNWLRRVVERGLSTDPSMRWPTMAELLTVLERDRTRARVRIISMVFAGSIVLTAGAEGYRRWDIVQEEEIRQRDIAQREAACEASGASVDGMWNGMAHKRVRDAFMATRVSYAATTADNVMPWLDEKAAAWKRARTDVCLNADVRHVWNQPIMDRALWCLEDRQMEMESLVSEFGRANATTLQKRCRPRLAYGP